jgi:hypothetical protein
MKTIIHFDHISLIFLELKILFQTNIVKKIATHFIFNNLFRIFTVYHFLKCKANLVPINTIFPVRSVCAHVREFAHLNSSNTCSIVTNIIVSFMPLKPPTRPQFIFHSFYNKMAGSQNSRFRGAGTKLAPLMYFNTLMN